MPSIGIIVIVIVVSILLFFLFREIICWYWKINERIGLAEKQNMLLEKILQNIIRDAPIIQTNNPDTIITKKDGMTRQENSIYASLSEDEKIKVDRFINYGLKDGDKLVINKMSRNIDRFDEKEWGKIIENHQQNEWIIISEKKKTSP